jgi:hypothetical protein
MTIAELHHDLCAEGSPAATSPVAVRAPRRYLYCIIDCPAGDGPFSLGPMGIDGGSEVFAVRHELVAAIVSDTSSQKLEITRGHAIAHQRVMEAAMQAGHTVLPIRFNTIAEDAGAKSAEQRIIDQVLVARRDEIAGLLTKMRTLVELGVKGLWPDMETVFRGVCEGSPEIQSLRKRLMPAAGAGAGAPRRAGVAMTSQIKLGEMVKKALEARKGELEARLSARLAPTAAELKKVRTFGDPMFANLALLVEKSRQGEVEAVLSAFQAEQAGGARIRCVGPLPPSSFLELVISWDD